MSIFSNTQEVSIINESEQVDFLSHIRRELLPMRVVCVDDCNSALGCPDCENDELFRYLVDEGDVIYLQFNLPDVFNEKPSSPEYGWNEDGSTHWLEIDLMNGDGSVALADLTNENTEDVVLGYAVGHYQGVSYQNVNVISNAIKPFLNSDCFYFRIRMCVVSYDDIFCVEGISNSPNVPPITNGFEEGESTLWNNNSSYQILTLQNGGWVISETQEGSVFNKKTGEYYNLNNGLITVILPPSTSSECEQFKYCYSMAYKFINCEKVVSFSGNAGLFDCIGRFYGRFGNQMQGNFAFRNEFKIEGSFETECFTPLKNVSDSGSTISTSLVQENRLRLDHIPENVAKRLSALFLLDGYLIDELAWDESPKVCKNNEDGLDWYVDALLTATECETDNFECEN